VVSKTRAKAILDRETPVKEILVKEILVKEILVKAILVRSDRASVGKRTLAPIRRASVKPTPFVFVATAANR
jgi:hypothetical protein